MKTASNVKHATRATSRAVGTSVKGAETDILSTLKQEHDEVKRLLSELQDTERGSQRRNLVAQIKAALLPHTKAEEEVVYDAVISMRNSEVQTDGYEGYLEHELAAKTLQRLEAIDAVRSPEHRATAKVLKELVEHHIQEEESSIWENIKQHFTEEDRRHMNAAFLAAKAKVKTH